VTPDPPPFPVFPIFPPLEFLRRSLCYSSLPLSALFQESVSSFNHKILPPLFPPLLPLRGAPLVHATLIFSASFFPVRCVHFLWSPVFPHENPEAYLPSQLFLDMCFFMQFLEIRKNCTTFSLPFFQKSRPAISANGRVVSTFSWPLLFFGAYWRFRVLRLPPGNAFRLALSFLSEVRPSSPGLLPGSPPPPLGSLISLPLNFCEGTLGTPPLSGRFGLPPPATLRSFSTTSRTAQPSGLVPPFLRAVAPLLPTLILQRARLAGPFRVRFSFIRSWSPPESHSLRLIHDSFTFVVPYSLFLSQAFLTRVGPGSPPLTLLSVP